MIAYCTSCPEQVQVNGQRVEEERCPSCGSALVARPAQRSVRAFQGGAPGLIQQRCKR